MLRLHFHLASPYSRKVLVALTLHQLPFERVLIDVRGGGLQTPAFRALSPFGKMPVIETDAGALFESTSIIEYLEERQRVLLPLGREREARHYDRLGDLYLLDSQATIWFQPQSPLAERAHQNVAHAWTLLAQRLATSPFLCGESFSLADLATAIGTHHLQLLGLTPPPAVQRWAERCLGVPALAEAVREATPILEAMLAARPSAPQT
jgi:glutathione S-transferase